MGFRHRKLMDEPPPSRSINSTMSTQTINSTVSEFCEPFCDPLVNDSGYCISPCLDLCPTNCHYTIPTPQFSGFPPPPPPPPSPGSRHVSPLLITAFVALSLAFLVVLGYVVCSRRANRGGRWRGRGRNIAQPQQSVPPRDDEFLDDLEGPVLDHPSWYIHTVGLPPSVIGKIAVCRYKGGEGLIEGIECSVCLTEFEEDETLRLLPKCSHAFHVPCIDMWLQSHTNCPNCRAPIIMSDARSPSPEPDNSWEEIRLDRGSDDVEITPESQIRGEAVEGSEQPIAGRMEDVVDEPKNGMLPI